jgi:hypothetical protein
MHSPISQSVSSSCSCGVTAVGVSVLIVVGTGEVVSVGVAVVGLVAVKTRLICCPCCIWRERRRGRIGDKKLRRMSDGVTPVLRQVVVTARHSWSSGACPVRSWKRSTRVTLLRASSYSQALLDVLSCSQLGSISVWIGCGWRIRCSEQRSCVSHSNISSGTRHSRDVGSRCAWSVYAAPLSICDDGVVLCCVV